MANRKDEGRKRSDRTNKVDSSSKIKKGNKISDKLQIIDLEQVEEATPSSDPGLFRADDTSLRPEKRHLELILDTLQRRDAYELFAEPVDPDEVEDYYEIIKVPMDFGTMRAKLHEDMYQSLEQFEEDVFLIFKNAMHFNSAATTYFKQARALDDMAKKVFHALKTDPEKFELEFSTTKRRSARKICSEDKDSNLGSCSKLSRNKRTNGERKGVDTRDERAGYKPWTSLLMSVDVPEDPVLATMNVESTPLVHVSQQEISYGESLMEFVKDLGPTAKRVAQRKMQQSQATKLNDYVINNIFNINKESKHTARTQSTKRSIKTTSKIMNKQIVLAVAAAPKTRGGRGCATRPRLTTKTNEKHVGLPPRNKDANKTPKKPRIEVATNKKVIHLDDHMDQNVVKSGLKEPSWQLNRLDLNKAAPWSDLPSNSGKAFGVAANTIGSTSSNVGKELHLEMLNPNPRSNGSNGKKQMQSSGVGLGQSYMQMQLGAFSFSWPNCMPNSNFGK